MHAYRHAKFERHISEISSEILLLNYEWKQDVTFDWDAVVTSIQSKGALTEKIIYTFRRTIFTDLMGIAWELYEIIEHLV